MVAKPAAASAMAATPDIKHLRERDIRHHPFVFSSCTFVLVNSPLWQGSLLAGTAMACSRARRARRVLSRRVGLGNADSTGPSSGAHSLFDAAAQALCLPQLGAKRTCEAGGRDPGRRGHRDGPAARSRTGPALRRLKASFRLRGHSAQPLRGQPGGLSWDGWIGGACWKLVTQTQVRPRPLQLDGPDLVRSWWAMQGLNLRPLPCQAISADMP
jgi:hypothetical protein